MTLNQIIRRIEAISEAHKMVRNFAFGMPTDFLTDKTIRYPSVFLQDQQGSLELSQKTKTINFKLFCVDLVHVSEDTKTNEVDVFSDMLSIAEDLIAEMNHSEFTDWKVAASNPFTLVKEEDGDMYGGVAVDLAIVVPYLQDACVVPTNEY